MFLRKVRTKYAIVLNLAVENKVLLSYSLTAGSRTLDDDKYRTCLHQTTVAWISVMPSPSHGHVFTLDLVIRRHPEPCVDKNQILVAANVAALES